MSRHSILLPVIVGASAVLSTARPSTAQSAPDRWNVQLELGFNGAMGNSKFTILRTGARTRYLQTEVAEFEISTLVRYGSSDQKVIANDQRLSLKLDLWPRDRWSPFVYQPAWNRASDFIVTTTTSVSTKVLEDVSLSVEHEYLHDSRPPPGVGPDDQKFSVLLKLTL
jgi:hypothetical protein